MNSPAPRWATTPRGGPTHGRLLVAVARLLGWELFDWQRLVADLALQYDPTTRAPLYRTVGVSVARQNGKTTLVVARIAMALLRPGATVAYTAQDRNLARFKWQEHVDLLMRTPFAERVERIDRVNGREQLVTVDGSRYLIVTPGERAGRGLSLDLAVIDEAFAHPDMALVGALQPTMAAKANAQLWLLSNAGNYTSGLWRHFTDVGRASIDDPHASMCWAEWAAADDAALNDPDAWAEANPSLGLPHGVTLPALADAVTTLDEATFRREHLNTWADLASIVGIDAVAWAACRDDDALLGPGAEVVLAVDITPNRDRGALVAAGAIGDRVAVELIESTSNVERLLARTVEVAERWGASVVLDRGGPAAAVQYALERAEVPVRLLSLPDVVQACGDFHDAVTHGRLAHRGDFRLTDAVAAATRRRVGDAWVWRRRESGDISPLVGATLARWGIVGTHTALQPMVW